MDYQTIINILGGGVLTAMGWFAKTLYIAVQELKTDLAKLRESLPKEYVPKDDFREFREEFRQYFRELNDKLDRKAEK